MKNYDVVIVGAGIIGLSIAWQIARRSKWKIAVVEKGCAVAEGSTGASSAICRVRYSSDEMVRLAHDGIEAYRHWREYTGLNKPRAQFHQDGVLWMPGSDEQWTDIEHARMGRLGITTEVLDEAQTRERFAPLSTCIVSPDLNTGETHACQRGGRNLFEPAGGYVDPVAAAQDLLEACRDAGVAVRFKSRVTAVGKVGGKVTSITLDNGDTIHTPLLISAAGPWCNELFEMAGIDLGWNLSPVRVQVLYHDRPPELTGHIPVTADLQSGIYFRTQNRGQQLVVGSVLEEDERETVANPDRFEIDADEDFKLYKLHLLHHRLPGLPYRGKVRGYCGLYTVNLDDVHPLAGPTELDGFWVANGFSGHGFKLAPAIGSILAQAITGERRDFDTRVRASFLACDRTPIKTDSKNVLA